MLTTNQELYISHTQSNSVTVTKFTTCLNIFWIGASPVSYTEVHFDLWQRFDNKVVK